MSDNWSDDQDYFRAREQELWQEHDAEPKQGCTCGFPTLYGRNAGTPAFETWVESGQVDPDCPVHGWDE